MGSVESGQIRAFLETLGRRYSSPAQLVLIGGSALCLLGSPRPTMDIDYVGDDLKKNDLQQMMEQIAREMSLDVEAVPIQRFMPLPMGEEGRSIRVGRFGQIEVSIIDPRMIALSKIERGFDTDIEDVVFLIRQELITLQELENIVQAALPRAREFDMNAVEMQNHLQAVHEALKK